MSGRKGDAMPILDRVYHRIDGWTQGDGSVATTHTTNDNEDRGYPGPVETWEQKYSSREQFTRICGKSRTGCFGCEVTVTLDGKKQ